MLDVIVVGAGLFGQVVAKALKEQGRKVAVFDAHHEEAGSKPAACLMKPSWFSGLGKEVYEPSLRLLDELYGVQDITFRLQPFKSGGKIGSATVHWVPPNSILQPISIIREEVKEVHPGRVVSESGEWEASLVVVAAGVWTERLLPQYRQTAQKGAAFLWKGHRDCDPFIWPYAPYRQLVKFDRGDGVWVGDGTAIKAENWTDDRVRQSLDRCARAAGFLHDGNVLPLLGRRPYAKGHKPCLLEEVQPGLWVASGGAKNGTVAAGYCAHVIKEKTS